MTEAELRQILEEVLLASSIPQSEIDEIVEDIIERYQEAVNPDWREVIFRQGAKE